MAFPEHQKKGKYRISYVPARFFTRVMAGAIDFVIVAIFVIICGWLMQPMFENSLPKDIAPWEAFALIVFATFAVDFLLYAPFWESKDGKTPGKTVMDLKVMTQDERIKPTVAANYTRAILRLVFAIPIFVAATTRERSVIFISLISPLIPYIWTILNRDGRAITDVWSNLVVMERTIEVRRSRFPDNAAAEIPEDSETDEVPEG